MSSDDRRRDDHTPSPRESTGSDERLALETRAAELLADRATGDLTPETERELAELLERLPELDDDSFEYTAAILELAFETLEEAPLATPLPAELSRRLARDAEAYFGEARGDVPGGAPEVAPRPEGRDLPPPTPFRPPSAASSWAPWLLAAAALFLALLAWWPRLVEAPADAPAPRQARSQDPPVGLEAPSSEQRREALIAELEARRDTLRQPLVATDDPAARAGEAIGETGATAGGEVAWNPELQEGFLRIRDLAVNDPAEVQYQLWIFDRARDERFPVDGGVFDMPAGSDEVLVPIDAKLAVDEPYLFAVTVEPPGGVVVSSRERIVLVAEV